MATSANKIYYNIYKDGKLVSKGIGYNILCKFPIKMFESFNPHSDFEYESYWYDEDEVYHKSELKSLEELFKK